MMKTQKLTIALLIFFIAFGCSPAAVTPSIQASPTETKATATTLPISSATVMPSATLEPDFPEGCINLPEIPLNTDVLNGLFVVYDFDNYSNHFLDPKAKQILSIEEKKQISSFASAPDFISARVSPNKKYLQAYSIENNFGMIRTVDLVIKTYDIQGQEDWNRGRWLDNERMFFQYWSDVPNGIYKIVIYNPFKGEQNNLQLDLPNAYIVEDTGGKVSWVKADIDSSLTKVLYNDEDERLVLWDLDSQKETASLPSPIDLLEGTWSPDGKEFAIPSPSSTSAVNELFTINMDGTVKKLTNFNQKYPFAHVGTRPMWSPDGRRLAYWLKMSNTTNADPNTIRQWLAITDTTTLDTQIYCLSANKPPRSVGMIVWSPDSTQVIVNTDGLGGGAKPVLVDLTHLTKSTVDTHGFTVSNWMTP
jgi:hypothetical protein